MLVTVQGKHCAWKGLISLVNSIQQVRRRINPRLELDGMVITMVDKRTNLSRDVSAALRRAYGHQIKIYGSEIPISTKTAESAATGPSKLGYDPNGAASRAEQSLAQEDTKGERTNVQTEHQSTLTR